MGAAAAAAFGAVAAALAHLEVEAAAAQRVMVGKATQAEVAAQCFRVEEAELVALGDTFSVARGGTTAKLVRVLAAVEAVAPYIFGCQARAKSAMEMVGTEHMPVAGVEVRGAAAPAASGAAAARGASVTAAMAGLVAAAARPLVLATAVPSVDMPTLKMVVAAPAWVAPFSATG